MTSSSLKSFGNVSSSDDYQEESGVLDSQNVEEQLSEAFDNLLAKSAKNRLISHELIRKLLSERYLYFDYVFNRKITILDSLDKCIKRSKGQDLGYAANLIAIICTYLGPSILNDGELDSIFNDLIAQLLTLLNDQTIQPDVRARCSKAIAICTFIIVGIEGYLEQLMSRYYAIFSASCRKGDNSIPNPNEQVANLHSACLQSWTLSLIALNNSSSPQVALDLIDEFMDKIVELLDSPHLDLKLSAGECLAVMCEIIKSHNDEVSGQDFDDLCDKLRDLLSEGQKSRGKKDLRQQRSNFREILAAIEEDEAPSLIIKFGRERLILDSWCKRRQYDAFCELLGAGTNHHLAENETLRDIFDLGAVLVHLDLPRSKRSDNSYENMIADKNRTKNLRKLRDKRADVIN